jgi:hypothetical protein
LALYGESGNPVSVRAEIHRLRGQLGPSVIRTKPYRLDAEVDADFLNLRKPLRERKVRETMSLWRGPLLPQSSAPGVCAERDMVLALVRSLVIERGDADTLWSFARVTPDQEALEALLRNLPRADPRRSWAEFQLRLCIIDD